MSNFLLESYRALSDSNFRASSGEGFSDIKPLELARTIVGGP